jgi:hypothetical protein
MAEKRPIILVGGLLCGWVVGEGENSELDTLEADRNEVIYKASGGTQRLRYKKHHTNADGIDVFWFDGYAGSPKARTEETID